MKIRPLDSVSLPSILRLSALPIVLATLALGCNDERLRELGYTIAQAASPVDDGAGEVPATCVPELIDADGAQREIAADLASAPEQSRPFLRYVSLTGRVDAGLCSLDLGYDREAVSKLLNSLSREPNVVVPRAFGDEDSLLRVDLRDYGWTHPIEVNGRAYADGWDALIGSAPAAIELTGDQASSIALATHTRVPVLTSDAFIDAAADSTLYYALLGVPATLGELRQSVGLPSELDPLENGATRAVTDKSRIVRLEGSLRVIDRYAVGAGGAGRYTEATVMDTGAFLADPLHLQAAAQRLIMFSLPNDLLAFAITDAAGARQGASQLVLDTNRNDFTANVSSSCSNCHAFGYIPLLDVARGTILGQPDRFDPELVAAYQASLDEVSLGAQFEADSQPYQQAVTRATGATEGGDPISSTVFRLAMDIGLAGAAAELLVSADELRSRLDELAPEFKPLAFDLTLSRATFSREYAGAYCVLHAADANPPAVGFCDAAR